MPILNQPVMHNLSPKFWLGQKVLIDKQQDLIGSITEIAFRLAEGPEPYVLYQVDWLHNGVNHSNYIAAWRLSAP